MNKAAGNLSDISFLFLLLGAVAHKAMSSMSSMSSTSADFVFSLILCAALCLAILGGSQVFQNTRLAGQKLKEAIEVEVEAANKDHWARDGNARVSEETIQTAASFLAALPSHCQSPSIAPEPDGHISLEWYINSECIFTASIAPRDTIFWAALVGGEDPRGSVRFVNEVPSSIRLFLGRVLSRV